MGNSAQPQLATVANCAEVGKDEVTSLVVHELRLRDTLGWTVLLVGDICPGPSALDFWGRWQS